MEADLQSGEQRGGREYEGVEVIGAGDGEEAEEKDDEDFAESEVSEREGSAGVGVGEEQRENSEREDGPAAAEDERDGESGGEDETDDAAGQHGVGGEQPAARGADRAESVRGVGAFGVVDGVVEIVGGDLDKDGAGEDERGEERIEGVGGEGQSGAGDDGDRGGAERARAGGEDPWIHRG